MFVDRKGVVERYSTNTCLNQTARTMIYIVMKKGITNLAEHVPTLRTLHAHVSWFQFLIAAKATTTSQKTNTQRHLLLNLRILEVHQRIQVVIRSRKVGIVRQHQPTNGTQQRQLTDNALTSRTLVVAVNQLHVASAVIGGLLSNSVSIPTVLLSIKGGNPIGCTSDDCFTGGTMMGVSSIFDTGGCR